TACSMPTPKSNPSSTKKPVHSTAMTMNQNWVSDMPALLVPHRGHRDVGGISPVRRAGQWLQVPPRVAQHQEQVQEGEGHIYQYENHQADDHVRGAHRRGHTILGQHEP